MRTVVYCSQRMSNSEGLIMRCTNIVTIILRLINNAAMRKPANEEGLQYLDELRLQTVQNSFLTRRTFI
jgi:hypothetical protein